MKREKVLLLLEDGAVFEGKSFGHVGEAAGETVFYTGVVGYQEVLTDPSYGGAILVCTYPIIGCYGVNDEDNESPATHPRGIVVKEYSPYYSNFRAKGALEEFLIEHEIVGIQEVDTRAVTVHLRDHGEMKGIIASGDADADDLLDKLKAAPSPFERDMVMDLPAPRIPRPRGKPKHRILILDLGVKNSLLAQLARLGCAVERLPCTASAGDILAKKAEGVIIPGGPGDPNVLTGVVETVKALAGKTPVLGIGLGHQVLALALGCKVKRLKVGHHGVNHPVRDLAAKHCAITIQHHSFVVDADSIPDSVSVTHRNVNDETVEGIRSKEHNARSVQFHPAPDEMGNPSKILEDFLNHK
ncbi:MAG: glutamine-hydrolyzing carbamoyl-phosphate synthase small subunit [Planctomycetota bacterium]